MVQIYYHDNLPGDYQEDHNSGRSVDASYLDKIGVLYKKFESMEDVDSLAAERHYKNRDVVHLTPETLTQEKLDTFYTEHLHEDEEIRYILEGSGFFDVRSGDDEWIRCKVEKNDLLILPAGIYHRFTLTTDNNVKALRLFQDEPKWVAVPRPEGDAKDAREEYLKSV